MKDFAAGWAACREAAVKVAEEARLRAWQMPQEFPLGDIQRKCWAARHVEAVEIGAAIAALPAPTPADAQEGERPSWIDKFTDEIL